MFIAYVLHCMLSQVEDIALTHSVPNQFLESELELILMLSLLNAVYRNAYLSQAFFELVQDISLTLIKCE
jgi:hypothetical protein